MVLAPDSGEKSATRIQNTEPIYLPDYLRGPTRPGRWAAGQRYVAPSLAGQSHANTGKFPQTRSSSSQITEAKTKKRHQEFESFLTRCNLMRKRGIFAFFKVTFGVMESISSMNRTQGAFCVASSNSSLKKPRQILFQYRYQWSVPVPVQYPWNLNVTLT